jgi:hypothetical protein
MEHIYFYKSLSEEEALQKAYEKGTLSPTPKEGLIINPKVAYHITEKDIVKSIPTKWVKENANIYGELSRLAFTDPVENLNWDFLYFKNTDVFRPAAIAFEKSERNVIGTNLQPTYTEHIKGTKSYMEFWDEEFKRINYGYEPIVDGKPCGVRISGEYYFYLNYTKMKKIERDKNGKEIDIYTFPSFLTMDYYYFKELEARENPEKFGLERDYKRSLVLAKSRRKGFSYKAAAGAVWITAFNDDARVGIASEANSNDATDAVKCARKCIPIIDHLTNFTPFGRKNPGNPKFNGGWKHENMKDTDKYFTFTFGLVNTKTKERRGRGSTIFTMSMSKDDAASGEGLNRLYFEEAGKISNLSNAWSFSRESLKAGSFYRGIAIIFGTGGEMTTASGKDGSSKPFSAMFYNPVAAEVASFKNIYEYKEQKKKDNVCGYFVSDMWSNFGAYIKIGGKNYNAIDRQGNAYFWVAELALNKARAEKEPPNGTQKAYNKYLTQRCKTPSEAFLITTGSYFNTADIIALRNSIKMSPGGFDKFRRKGDLVEKADGSVEFKIDIDGNYEPVISMDYDNSNRDGCLLVYEFPKVLYGEIPEDAYIITVDPIGKNNSGGSSLNAVIVLKTPKYAQYFGHERIVATYFGRKDVRPLDYLHNLLYKLSKFYNAKITFENDQDGGILNYFVKKNALMRLLPSPRMVTKRHLPNSKTLLREFGHSMASPRHKTFGENYVNEWLDYRHPSRQAVDETGEVVRIEGKRNLDMLEDEFLIEQLIHYDREGNYDAVDALMGGIIQFEERFAEEDFNYLDSDYVKQINSQILDYYSLKYNDERSRSDSSLIIK